MRNTFGQFRYNVLYILAFIFRLFQQLILNILEG